MMPRWLQAEESPAFRRRCANSTRCPHARERWGNKSAPTMARASCERCIASYIAAPHFRCCRRHRMTDAGMQLDRAGGGAASGEGERLPGMALLIPAGGRKWGIFLSRKKEKTNRISENCRRQYISKIKSQSKRLNFALLRAAQKFTSSTHFLSTCAELLTHRMLCDIIYCV